MNRLKGLGEAWLRGCKGKDHVHSVGVVPSFLPFFLQIMCNT